MLNFQNNKKSKMITNFVKETEELTTEEKELALYIAIYLKARRKQNPVTSNEIIIGVKRMKGITLSGARLRKVVRWIRLSGEIVHLMATSKGYYVCTDKEEWDTYIQSLEERWESIKYLADAMQWQGDNIGFEKITPE